MKRRNPRPPKDLAILAGPTEDGKGARMLRLKQGELSAGELRPVREGQPLGKQELVRLHPLHARSPVCEVEVLHAPQRETETHPRNGPARVSNRRYRHNWSHVFAPPGKAKRGSGGDWSVN